jgi:hypothetical protein
LNGTKGITNNEEFSVLDMKLPMFQRELLPFSSVKYWIYPSNLKSVHYDVQDDLFHHSSKELAQGGLWNSQNKPYYPFSLVN